MPFIQIHTSITISPEQEEQITAEAGKAIAYIPGKQADSLMLIFDDHCRIHLGRCTEPLAYVEASLFGNEDHHGYDLFSAAVTSILEDVLHIPAEHIYIRYDDISAWSYAGHFIDRRYFR